MKNLVEGQNEVVNNITKIFQIFKTSECVIRPHFILTGPSGSGKSFTIASICASLELPFIEINAAPTKYPEGFQI